jgi:hypothetical protein
MDYLKELLTYGKTLLDNKWTVLFIVFGILVAYSMGKSFATGNKIEDFETRCEKEKNLYDDNKPKLKEKDEDDEDDEDDDSEDDGGEPEPVEKKIKTIASANNPSTSNSEMKCPDLSQYTHKSLIPDLSGYLSKEYVKKNYISKEKLNKNYVRKSDCLALSHKDEPIEETEDSIPISTKPSNKKEKVNVEDKQIQNYYDKNKETMDVPYSALNDAFCNKKSCFINGFPNGLHPQ